MSSTYPSDLSDTEWDCLQRSLLPLPRRGRPRPHPLRAIFDAIFDVVRTGCAWRYLPANFPPWQTVFYHFRRWRLTGIWYRIYTALHAAERERGGRDAQPSAGIMDAQSVKTVEESARISGYDGHKCVKGRKRHRLVDTLGLPIAVYVTPADGSDPAGQARARSSPDWPRWCPGSRRSGPTRPTAERTSPTAVSSTAAGSWRSWSGSPAPAASRCNRAGGSWSARSGGSPETAG